MSYQPDLQRLKETFALLADPVSMSGPDDRDANVFVYDLVAGYKHQLLERVKQSYPQHEDLWQAARVQQEIETLRHRYALRCLKDLRSSAALVKEIAFADPPLNPDGTFHAVDLGTGSGVLAVGAAIAGLRAGARTAVVHMVDSERFLLDAAADSVGLLDERIDCRPVVQDITEPALYGRFPLRNVRFWITETISQGLPPARIIQDHVFWTDRGSHNNLLDPFPEVVHQLIRHVPDLPENVRTGATRFFPDLFRGDFIPGQARGMRLRTSKSHAEHESLNTVGADFLCFDANEYATRW